MAETAATAPGPDDATLAPEADLLANLSPRAGLMLEFARSLARYQGGSLAITTDALRHVRIELVLPLADAAADDGEPPIQLADFRKSRQDAPSAKHRTPVKKHA